MSNFTALIGIGKDEDLHPSVIELLEEESNFGFDPQSVEVGWEATINGEETRILTDWKLTIVELFTDAPVRLDELLKKHQKHYIMVRV